MKKWMLFSTMVAVVSIAAWGCGGEKKPDPKPADPKPATGTTTNNPSKGLDQGKITKVAFTTSDELACLKCGHGLTKADKDAHKCEDHVACEKCKLHEDSPLCCKIDGVEGKLACLACGQIAGSETCCKADASVCQKCGYHEESALCCKAGSKPGFEAAKIDTQDKGAEDKGAEVKGTDANTEVKKAEAPKTDGDK